MNIIHKWRGLLILFGTAIIVVAAMLFSLRFLSGNLHAAPSLKSEPSTETQSLFDTGIMTSTDLLAIYALAFDNNPTAPLNLSLYYTSTIDSIAAATRDAPDKTAVILADRSGSLDTRILIAQNGQLIPVTGLPIPNPEDGTPILDESFTEYNMSNGVQLGLFLQWTRQTFSADTTTFSFLGHGAPLVPELDPALPQPAPTPEIDIDTALDPTDPAGATIEPPVPPLPSGAFVHSGFTDFTSASLISIHALAEALEMGTENGENPFQTVDLVQCFASSIEEIYELYPYAETLTGSPNYTYSKPEMIGTALNALSGGMSAVQIADTLIQTYDNELPANEHPRLLVAVESSKVEAIKESWDMASYHLNEQLNQDREATRNKIANAYSASSKYDTTLCNEPDFRLEAPDSVSDMSDFASQIGTIFGPTSPTGSWAITTTQRIDEAIISRYARSGIPWFALDDEIVNAQGENILSVQEWSFDSPGISLYTDFGATVKWDVDTLDWHSAWYTSTANINHLNYINPTPYSFLTGGPNGISWANVFNQYWSSGPTDIDVRCKPAFLAGRGVGEMSVLSFEPSLSTSMSTLLVTADSTLRLDEVNEGSDGSLMRFEATINTSIEAVNPQVRFHVYNRKNEQIFAEAVPTGYLEAGETKLIESNYFWLLKKPGDYTFEVVLDADGRFIEENEVDNIVRYAVEILPTISIVRVPFVMQ